MPPKRKAPKADSPPKEHPKELKSENPNPTPTPNPQFKPYPISKTNRLLEPGPVLLVSTTTAHTPNLMTIGFHMMVQHSSPTLVGVCIGPWDHSFAALQQTKTCVLAVPDASIVEKVVDIGNCSGESVDKWRGFGFEAVGGRGAAPLVGGQGIIANVECVVEDESLVQRFNLWVLRVVGVWVRGGDGGLGRMVHHRGDGRFVVDGEELDLRERMVKWRMFQD